MHLIDVWNILQKNMEYKNAVVKALICMKSIHSECRTTEENFSYHRKEAVAEQSIETYQSTPHILYVQLYSECSRNTVLPLEIYHVSAPVNNCLVYLMYMTIPH